MINQEPLDLYASIQPLVEADARRIADEILSEDQYTVATTQGHTHNNIDSPQLDYFSLANKVFQVPHTIFGTQAATAGNYGIFYIATSPCLFTGALEVHQVLGTDGSAVTLQIEKLTGTTVPGSGTNLLATSFNLKSTINTVQTANAVLSSNPAVQNATTYLAVGNRLALKLTGTPTDVANVTVVAKLTLVP